MLFYFYRVPDIDIDLKDTSSQAPGDLLWVRERVEKALVDISVSL